MFVPEHGRDVPEQENEIMESIDYCGIRRIRSIEISSGAFLYRQGMPVRHLYLLQSGKAGISRRDHHGVERIATVLKPGDIAGLDDLFRQPCHSSGAIALEPLSVQIFPSEFFLEEICSDCQVAMELLSQLSRRIGRSELWRNVHGCVV